MELGFPRKVDRILKKAKAPEPFRLYPHEVAESEEEEISPVWGDISKTDTGLDSIEPIKTK